MNVSFISTYELALSNQTGSGLLVKCPPGDEACGLSMRNDTKTRTASLKFEYKYTFNYI
ncbi:hypothetical protein I4U23_005114 [Adineta vaga]|nr:hypothetical protein I4U23_005114 [Adineta vaga]